MKAFSYQIIYAEAGKKYIFPANIFYKTGQKILN